MKLILSRLIVALGLGSVVYTTSAASIYICQVDGRTTFSQSNQGGQCLEAQTTEVSTEVVSDEAASAVSVKANVPEQTGYAVAVPEESDIKILPSTPTVAVKRNTSAVVNPKLNIKLRHGNVVSGTKTEVKSAKTQAAELNRRAKIIPAPIIAAPQVKPKPQLTRKQILQNEVSNEQTALGRTQAQLNAARKKGDAAKISRLEQNVRDHQANIRAIQSEMIR